MSMRFSSIFAFYMGSFIRNTVLFVSASAATLINIRNARKHFEQLERVDNQSFITR